MRIFKQKLSKGMRHTREVEIFVFLVAIDRNNVMTNASWRSADVDYRSLSPFIPISVELSRASETKPAYPWMPLCVYALIHVRNWGFPYAWGAARSSKFHFMHR